MHFVKFFPFTKKLNSQNVFCKNSSLHKANLEFKKFILKIFPSGDNSLRRTFGSGAEHPAPRIAILSPGNTTFAFEQYHGVPSGPAQNILRRDSPF